MKVTKVVTVLVSNEEVDIATSYVPDINTFHILELLIDVTAYDLSEKWGVTLAQATRTLKNTIQKFLRGAILPLARRYHTYRLFTRNTLQGQCSCDMMNRRYKSMDGNQYAQVFVNNTYFVKV